MKKIRRTNVTPPTLRLGSKGGDEARRREQAFAASQQISDVNSDFHNYWGEPDVRGALWAMHGRSCGYCDRELPGNDRGDVEHFRPKDVYWWLAYTFENYLLSCSRCNSAYKRTRFPIIPPGAPFDYDKKDQLAEEGRALIEPTADDVDGWFGLDFDEERVKTQSFQLILNAGLGLTETTRCLTTIDLFKLNEDSELLRARLVAVHKALRLIEKANNGDEDCKQELRRQASRFCSHSFAVRQTITSRANRPEYLPSSDEEVSWLLDEFLDLLRFALNTLEKRPQDTTESNQRDRCAWAIAVLMKDPPALSTAAIRDRLQKEARLDLVEPLYNQL